MAFATRRQSGQRDWSDRIAQFAQSLIGSRVELIGRFASIGAGVTIVALLLREPRLFVWLGLFLIGQSMMFAWILTRKPGARQWEYVLVLALCMLNSVAFLCMPVWLWLQQGAAAQFSATFFLIGFAIYGISRNATVQELAVIDAIPVVAGAVFMATDFAAEHLAQVNLAVPICMLGIIVSYYLLSLRENFVTRRRLRMAEELAVETARHQVVARLTAGVAHDFNNILTAVLGHLDLHEALSDPNEKAQSVRAAHAAATRAARLTGQLLAFAGKAPLEAKLTDLGPVLRDFSAQSRGLLSQDVALHTNLPDGLPPVMVDRAHLDHAMAQLLLNAIDSMPDGGTVTLSLGLVEIAAPRRLHGKTRLLKGTYCVITMADEGRGIMPHDIERVYEPFYTTKKKGQASGLGLSVVAGFAAQSGGAIGLVSRPGEGTVVSFYLPAVLQTGPES